MPLETRFYDFEAELERIDGVLQDVAEQLAPLDPETDTAKAIESQGNRLETHRRGLRWAQDAWDVDGVELCGLAAGEYGRMQDDLPDGAGGGATRVYYIAHGTVNAPYVDDSDIEETLGNVAGLPLAYAKWAEAQINDLTTVGADEGNRFYALLEEKRSEATSTENAGSSTS